MRKYSFILFLVISFVISVPLFVLSTQQSSAGVIVLLFLLGSYAPALAAWIVVRGGTEEERIAFRSTLWKWGNGKWFLLALILPTAIWLLAYVTTNLLDKNVDAAWQGLAGLPVILLVNYGEEVGWRGYTLPHLMRRVNPFVSSLMIGVIWGLFHVSLNWQRPLFAILTFCATLVLSVILAWMFVNTKSILPGLLLHSTFNAWVQVFVTGENVSVLVVAIILFVFVAGFLFVRFGKELVTAS